jgi:hypothetical protein
LRQQHYTKTGFEKQLDITEVLKFLTTQNHFSDETEIKTGMPFNKTKEPTIQPMVRRKCAICEEEHNVPNCCKFIAPGVQERNETV